MKTLAYQQKAVAELTDKTIRLKNGHVYLFDTKSAGSDASAHEKQQHYIHAYHFPGAHTPTAEEVREYYVPLVERLIE